MFRATPIMTAQAIQAAYEAGLDAIKADQQEIDLAQVTAVDSTAVAALMGWRRAALQKGVSLRFLNIPANLQSLAGLYGVAELLQVQTAAISLVRARSA